MSNRNESSIELRTWQVIVIAVVLALVFAGLVLVVALVEHPHCGLEPITGAGSCPSGLVLLPQGANVTASSDHLNVSVVIPQVFTSQYETITLATFTLISEGNNTTFVPGTGPVSLELQDAGQNVIPGFGCSDCNLTDGVYATTIYLDPTFNSQVNVGACPAPYVGRVFVIARDLGRNMTASAFFDLGVSPTYQAQLDQCERDAGNATIQAKNDAILGGATALVAFTGIVYFALVTYTWALAAHKRARRDSAWSWWDTVRFRLRTRAAESPMNLLLDDHRTWAKTVPLELKQMNDTQRIRWVRAELLRHGQLLDELAKYVKDRQDYVRRIRDLRTPQGLSEETFLQRYAPVPEDFVGKNRKPPAPAAPPGGAAP